MRESRIDPWYDSKRCGNTDVTPGSACTLYMHSGTPLCLVVHLGFYKRWPGVRVFRRFPKLKIITHLDDYSNMGDISAPPTSRRPGIALVRPNLHDNTQQNRDLFKRWSKLHMRDTLSIPKNDELGRASRVMRYARTTKGMEEEYLFTIVLDDVRLPGTDGFQRVPQRLDLESTRALNGGEEPVLERGDARTGTEPMVFSIVAPSVGIFEAVTDGGALPSSPRTC